MNDIMEFDHVVEVHPDGSVTARMDIYAPEVYYDSTDGSIVGVDGWTPLDGYSGQYGYSGPVMHPSEFIGGSMATDILSEPGLYVAVVVTNLDDDEPAGWAVLRQEVSA